jgi:hypothetical protein
MTIPVSSGQLVVIGSITVPPGHWEIFGSGGSYLPSSPQIVENVLRLGISNVTTGFSELYSLVNGVESYTYTTGTGNVLSAPTLYHNSTNTVVYYLLGQSFFAGPGTTNYLYGTISARRIR